MTQIGRICTKYGHVIPLLSYSFGNVPPLGADGRSFEPSPHLLFLEAGVPVELQRIPEDHLDDRVTRFSDFVPRSCRSIIESGDGIVKSGHTLPRRNAEGKGRSRPSFLAEALADSSWGLFSP